MDYLLSYSMVVLLLYCIGKARNVTVCDIHVSVIYTGSLQ